MSAARVEAVMARLYVDAAFRDHFLESPAMALETTGLTLEERSALAAIDRVGLMLASESFATKRVAKARTRPQGWARILAWLRRPLS